LLLIYSGLAPWTGWRDLGLDPLAFLTAPVPRYVTRFDLIVNVLAYFPFGVLAVFALHPRLRGLAAVAIAAIVGFLLAGSIETAQSYLPTRVASNLDLLANTIGALLGAGFSVPFAARLVDGGRLAALRTRWFEHDASTLLLLVALWPAAQIYPTSMLFGNGDLQAALTPLVEALGGSWPTLDGSEFGVAEFVLAEAFVVAASILAVGLALTSVMRPAAPRYPLLSTLLLSALATRSVAHAVLFGPERAFVWLTPGAYGGLALGALSLAAASGGSRRWLVALSLISVLALLVVVNVVPENPYFHVSLQEWRQGRLLNFNALADWLSIAWPLALLAWLLLRRR
jgi:VanZ family protein